MPGCEIRNIRETDFSDVKEAAQTWFPRPMGGHFNHFYFRYFTATSFAAVLDGALVGFIIGFLSPSGPREAYIHGAAVHPAQRRRGIARWLYENFFAVARAAGYRRVVLQTRPTNRPSIAFHTRLGFAMVREGAEPVDDLWVARDYEGPGEDRVRFARTI